MKLEKTCPKCDGDLYSPDSDLLEPLCLSCGYQPEFSEMQIIYKKFLQEEELNARNNG